MLQASALLIDAEMPPEVSDTRGQTLCDSTSVRYPELAKSQTESRTVYQRLGQGKNREGEMRSYYSVGTEFWFGRM